ncbi:MAG: SDR family NAD(P)-dependent oxidoreductase, partial [Gemmatimonadetes bacterium]|nr:SDR family NAD(P)-dependent oxidoreductase [Gemmatimonadota bacterium]
MSANAAYNPLSLVGKVILVTGASSGIGRETAVVLARLGARVVLSGRRQDALEETLARMPSPEAHRVEAFDLGEVDAIPEWMKRVRAAAGAPLDGVVHSAGVASLAPLRTASRKAIEGMMLPNVYAALM